ncbi:MAG: cytochrome b subunit of the bc complex [Candidatus Coatesbacteria bacterium]|nr:MAG: cytochrome b subunit of the bc complex [Candidatus Coatesbacteria bacterium]
MKRKDHPFWPHHVIEQVIQAFLVIAVILTLALVFPAGIGEKADPVTTPEHVKPEWYFLAVYQLLKFVPRLAGIVGMILVFAALPFFPFFFDRDPEKRRPFKRPVFFFVGIALIIWFVAFTIWGKIS